VAIGIRPAFGVLGREKIIKDDEIGIENRFVEVFIIVLQIFLLCLWLSLACHIQPKKKKTQILNGNCIP
jgi:hypothetical protein